MEAAADGQLDAPPEQPHGREARGLVVICPGDEVDVKIISKMYRVMCRLNKDFKRIGYTMRSQI